MMVQMKFTFVGSISALPFDNGRPLSFQPMTKLLTASAVSLLVFLLANGANAAERAGGHWQRMLETLNATSPYPVALQVDQGKGWLQGVWGGIKTIWEDGDTDIYLSGRYWHTPWGFSEEDRAKYDDWGLGGGYGRSLLDERGNQRLLYAMAVQDSFEKPMYLIGYGWLARWSICGNLNIAAGYSLVLLSNDTASDYIPFPAPVPLASIGDEKISLFCTFFNSIFYIFAKLSF